MSWVVFDPRGLKSFQFDFHSPEEFPDTLTFNLWVRVLWKFLSIVARLIGIPDIFCLISGVTSCPGNILTWLLIHYGSK